MFKIAVGGGHGINTAGKRSPDGTREWTYNNKVVVAFIAEMMKYQNVQIIRLDDPSGKRDVPLTERVNRANAFGADVYVSIHHNANTGVWGTWTGSETYVMKPASSNPKSVRLAKAVHPRLVKAMGLRDRGIKDANFQELRTTKMPAILTEAGYMDSSIDVVKMRNNTVMAAQGRAIAQGVAEYGKLKLKSGSTAPAPAAPKPAAVPLYRIRKTWADAGSQKGAYASFAGAKALADKHPGYSVFDAKGKNVYDPARAKREAAEKKATEAELARIAAQRKVDEANYKKAISLGITDGSRPNEAATRKQVTVMIMRALDLK